LKAIQLTTSKKLMSLRFYHGAATSAFFTNRPFRIWTEQLTLCGRISTAFPQRCYCKWIYASMTALNPAAAQTTRRGRNFLIDAYRNWDSNALLGGTNAIVRLAVLVILSGRSGTMPVDVYYGCVDPITCV
jgi:hypothetical protein